MKHKYVHNFRSNFTLEKLVEISSTPVCFEIDAETKARVDLSRKTLESFISDSRVIYGVNTGVGGFVDRLLPLESARRLQRNILNAVATNVGQYLDITTTRAVILSRIISLSRGNSAISLSNLEKLIAVFNSGIAPCVPLQGSLGTSGDLGPLAAIALVCIGEWKANLNNVVISGTEALKMAGVEPMDLSYKEGLALINGTSGMVGLGAMNLIQADRLLKKYLDISALALEGLAAKKKPFDPRVHKLKPHIGQQEVAEHIWGALSDSNMIVNEADIEKSLSAEMSIEVKQGSDQIEDAYSIRCTPQVLGPVKDSLKNVRQVLENELNSSNDNPLIVPEEDEVFHNGHFHGQYVAMAMDHLTIALTTMCNLSNRRIDRFLDSSNSNGLPKFLCTRDPGLQLGLMGGQFMTASVTAENRTLTIPLSVQSLTSTADFQDIVSFGFVAARRAREVLNNTRYVISFELMCACQAADIRGKNKLSSKTKELYEEVRSIVPFIDADITITPYLEEIKTSLLSPIL